MVRERIKEIVDFVSSESPYNAANKGWLNEDVYIQWGKSTTKNNNSANEMVNVSVFWNPIQLLISIVFGVLLISTIFVFSVVSFSNGRFDISTLIPLKAPEAIQKVNESVLEIIEEGGNVIKAEQQEETEVLSDIDTASEDLSLISAEEASPLMTLETPSEDLSLISAEEASPAKTSPKQAVETGNMLQPKQK